MTNLFSSTRCPHFSSPLPQNLPFLEIQLQIMQHLAKWPSLTILDFSFTGVSIKWLKIRPPGGKSSRKCFRKCCCIFCSVKSLKSFSCMEYVKTIKESKIYICKIATIFEIRVDIRNNFWQNPVMCV